MALLILAAVSILAPTGRSVTQEPENYEAVGHLVSREANVNTLVYLQVVLLSTLAFTGDDHFTDLHARCGQVWSPLHLNGGSRQKTGYVEAKDEKLLELEGFINFLTLSVDGQQYRLGKWLRARYGRWFGSRFDSNEIYIRSSDYNRTLMSAQANMAGLFPPSKSELWETGLPWQPIPIHSVPRIMDKELYEDILCPTASEEFTILWKSNIVRQMESENSDFIQFLADKTGIPNFEFRKLWLVYDHLFCMLQHNDTISWPSWVNTSVFDRIERLYDASSRLKFYTETLRRLRGGPLLKDIIERFEAKAKGLLGEKPKFYAYSAHDTTLSAMLAAIGIYPKLFPRYSSAVLLELHNIQGQFIVEVYHKNETDVDNLYHYHIPGCQDPCTLEAFKTALKRFLPGNWKEECGLAESEVNPYIFSTAILGLTSLILASILVLDVLLKRKRRSTLAREPLIADIDKL